MRLTESLINVGAVAGSMFHRLPLPHRRKTCYPQLPVLAEHQLSSGPPASRSLEDALRAFRQDCAENTEKTFSETWESGRRYMTHAGFRVRSKAEKIIADFLTKSGLRFLYEPPLRVAGVFMRPDFYLIDYALPYEHFGLRSADYLRAAELKIAAYHRAGAPFMYTTFNDEPDIEDVIVDKLAEATLDL